MRTPIVWVLLAALVLAGVVLVPRSANVSQQELAAALDAQRDALLTEIRAAVDARTGWRLTVTQKLDRCLAECCPRARNDDRSNERTTP